VEPSQPNGLAVPSTTAPSTTAPSTTAPAGTAVHTGIIEQGAWLGENHDSVTSSWS